MVLTSVGCPHLGCHNLNNPYLFTLKSQVPQGKRTVKTLRNRPCAGPGCADIYGTAPVTRDETRPVPAVQQPLICGNGNA